MVPNQVRYQTALHLVKNWRRRRDSNPRTGLIQPNPLAGDPLEPLEYFSIFLLLYMAERVGFEPTVPLSITGFQDQLLKPLGHLSTVPGDPSEARTRDTLIKSQVLYQLS